MAYRKLRRFRFGREDLDQEAAEELRHHRRLLEERLINEGLEPERAAAEARRRLGDVDQHRRQCEALDRRHRLRQTLAQAWTDARHGLRRMARRPGFTAVTVLTASLGVGVAVTLFSLVNALLLRPLPGVVDVDGLVHVVPATPEDALEGFSWPDFEDLRDSAASLSALAAFTGHQVSLQSGPGAEPRMVVAQWVSADFFPMLGTRPHRGRFFSGPQVDTLGAAPGVVLSHSLWQRHFAGDPAVLGRTLRVNGATFTVLGVAEEGFTGTFVGFACDLWLPVGTAATVIPGLERQDRRQGWLELLGRRAPDADLEQARRELTTLAEALRRDHRPQDQDWGLAVHRETGFDPSLHRPVVTFVTILMTVAVMVAVLAAFNLATLLLAQGSERRREMAVRLALGVGRGRLLRQLLAETAALALAAAGGGLLLAFAGVRALDAFIPRLGTLTLHLDLSPDPRVVGFAVLLAMAVTLGAGLAPALRAARSTPSSPLRSGRGDTGAGRATTVLVALQVAVVSVLLIGGALFLRAMQHAASVELGLEPERVLTATLRPPAEGADEADQPWPSRLRRLDAQFATLPGVTSASRVVGLPLSPAVLVGRPTTPVEIPDHAPPPGRESLRLERALVAPGYFRVMGIPRLAGRTFESADASMEGTAPAVAVINRTLARRFFHSEAAAPGSVLRVDGQPTRIVGVVEDSKVGTVHEDPRPFLYLHLDQHPVRTVTLVLRTAGDPAPLAPAVRRQLRQAEPDAPILHVAPMMELVRTTLLPQRMAASLTGTFGLLGLLLATVGVAGLLAQLVRRRRREIGVRLALGASRGRVLRRMLRLGLRPPLAGLAVGLPLALAATRVLEGFLIGVSPRDPWAFGGVALLLLAATALATWLPARHAARVDPTEVMRGE